MTSILPPRFLAKTLLMTSVLFAAGAVSAATLSGVNETPISLSGNNDIAVNTNFVNESSLGNTGTLDNNGTVVNVGSVDNSGTLNSNATLINVGTLGNSGTLNSNGMLMNIGTVDNNGTFTNSGLLTNNIGNLNNNSTGLLVNTGTMTNNSALNNNGIFLSEAGSVVNGDGDYTQEEGTSIINGTLTQSNVMINGGELNGSGTINGNVAVNGFSEVATTVAPGNSIGTLTVNGDYTQGAFTAMAIEFNETSIDLLDISGTATLGGELSFDFTGTDITEGSFTFLTFSTLASGSGFDTVIFPMIAGFDFDVVFGDTFANLVVTQTPMNAVPVPAALFLFGPVLFGLLGFHRKGRRAGMTA